MEGKTHFERVVGGTEKEREDSAADLQRVFEKGNKRFSEYQLEKTPEDLEILNKTETIVDKIVAQYGGDPKPLPINHIYILKPDSVFAISEGKFRGGIHNPYGLNVGAEKGKSKLLFAGTVAHELFHLKSYKSARVGKPGEGAILYRSGLSMIDKKDTNKEVGDEKEYFAILEEAIVVECTRKFLDEIREDPDFKEETVAFEKFRDWVAEYHRREGVSEEIINEEMEEIKYIEDVQDKVEQVLSFSDDEKKRQPFAAGMFASMYKKGQVEWVERRRERKKMYELLDKLVVNSGGKFKNRDQIFDEFAKANFSGNYLALGRVVEDILGKGSFRKLAEEFSLEPKKESADVSEAVNP